MKKHLISSQLQELTKKIVDTYEKDEVGIIDIDLRHRPPSRTAMAKVLTSLLGVFYPGYHGMDQLDAENMNFHLGALLDGVAADLSLQLYRAFQFDCRKEADPCPSCEKKAEEAMVQFFAEIPQIRKTLLLDVRAAYEGDPAAKSYSEIIVAYPGLLAITIYRVAHVLHRLGTPTLPRMMTEFAHAKTGIDIHPGADIGRSFFIDHGTGVVIGETTIIRDHVRIYQGVTLGGLSIALDEEGKVVRGTKRHPTIENNVVIYAGATILGGNTTIGEGSIIGGNTWVVKSVPPHSKVINESKSSQIGAKEKVSDAKKE